MLDLPEELARLTSLRKLWLTQNALRSLPASLGQLSGLQALLAANNLFKEVPPVSEGVAGVVLRAARFFGALLLCLSHLVPAADAATTSD